MPHSGELTAAEMRAAAMLVEGQKRQDVVVETEIAMRSLERLILDPKFIAYQDVLRKIAAEKIAEGHIDWAKRIRDKYWEFACLPPTANYKFDAHCKALDSLREMLKVGVPGAVTAEEDKPEEPDVYRAAWMQ